MLVLDTDHMSLLEWGGEGSGALCERLADIAPDQVATTIISYEKQMRG
jgi:tRNA(fMet)-specific endonuclease VapC